MWNLLSFSLLLLGFVFNIPAASKSSVVHTSFAKEVSITPTVSSSLTPALTSSPTVTTTSTPTVIPTSIPSPVMTSTPTPTASGTGGATDVQNYLLQGVNDFRLSKGLSKVSMNSQTCDFAATRAKEIASNFNHDGFTNRLNSKILPYPSYSLVTENIAMNSDYKQVVSLWIQSPGHAENMQKDTPFVCVVQYGNYYAYEGWKP